jgi:small subunit ribosomal protein S5
VRLIPASPGTGVVAGQSVRAILEMAGITDCLTKCFGSTNSINTIKAVFAGLERLRTAQQVAELRGVQLGQTAIETKLEKGKAFVTAMPRVRKPEQRQERPRGGGGRGRGGGGGGRGGGGGGRGGPRKGPRPESKPAEAPPAAAGGGEAPQA